MSSFNSVHALSVGYCRASEERPAEVMHSNCSSTLIRTASGLHIVVDTQTPWHQADMLEALASHRLTPADVAYLVCTHGHSDHVGCNALFVHARQHIVGHDVSSPRDAYHMHDFAGGAALRLGAEADGVRVEATPGHTAQCVSVVVPHCGPSGTDVVVCAGDLFECAADVWDARVWLAAGSQRPAEQRRQRRRVAEMATHIVPGHGEMFAVTEEMRRKLAEDVRENGVE